jgi:hypothetical protein
MAEFAKHGAAMTKRETITIEVERRGDYTDEYRAMTKDFYLKF